VSVYAACFSGRRPVVARFRSIELEPGRPAVLDPGDPNWTLSAEGGAQAVAVPRTEADSTRCSG
jgi:hypothetical protein